MISLLAALFGAGPDAGVGEGYGHRRADRLFMNLQTWKK